MDLAQLRSTVKGMGFISWIVLGLVAGALAKAILPGRQGGGWLSTLLLGVVGALVGGYIGSSLFNISLEGFFSMRTWLLSIGGSVLVLAVWGFLTRKN